MPPDLNSLPSSSPPPDQSLSPSSSPSPIQSRLSNNAEERRQPSPRSSSVSLAATASINAGFHTQDAQRSSTSSNRSRVSPHIGGSERRRSNVAMSLSLNNPALPAPGELQPSDPRSTIGHTFRTSSPQTIGRSPTIATGDPHHQRAPSLGELHQELEQEQEAQVNRLLHMIRQQQAQLQAIQASQPYTPSTSTAAIEDFTPTSERSSSFPTVSPPIPFSVTNPRPRSPVPRASLSRRSSRRSHASSFTGSPSLRPLSAGLHSQGGDEWLLSSSAGRDESAYYQAETQTLTRENQMLRQRIRELERQINEVSTTTATAPSAPSNLAVAPPLEASQPESAVSS